MRLNAFVIALAMTLTVGAAVHAQTDLISSLSKTLGSSTQQAEGAAGSLFNLAQSRMKPEDWSKVAGAVPGMDKLLKAAPAAPATPVGTTGIPGASNVGGLASVTSAFNKLGLKPELVSKAVPILTEFVTKSGGADVGKLLANALK